MRCFPGRRKEVKKKIIWLDPPGSWKLWISLVPHSREEKKRGEFIHSRLRVSYLILTPSSYQLFKDFYFFTPVMLINSCSTLLT